MEAVSQHSDIRLDTILYTRRKDCVDATASVQCELHSPEPWFKDLLPNASNLPTFCFPSQLTVGSV
jgi:hypothetical protein